jgi:ribokinase
MLNNNSDPSATETLTAVPLPLEALPPLPPLNLAVVGHVEMVSFVEVAQLPPVGTITAAKAFHQCPAGGGAVVAAQLAKLTGQPVRFFTALGRDATGEQAARELTAMGLELHVAWREAPTRQAITFIDGDGERTITVIGERLAAHGSDALPWQALSDCDGVFVTAADADALRQARRAKVLTATPRTRLGVLQEAGVKLDALIGSALDPAETYRDGDLNPPPTLVFRTAGDRGGQVSPGGRFLAPQRKRPVADTYGAGDSFAAGVTAALAAQWPLAAVISLGCHCGAACLDGKGPYGGQLRLAESKEGWVRGLEVGAGSD